jgi:hypothetical protein
VWPPPRVFPTPSVSLNKLNRTFGGAVKKSDCPALGPVPELNRQLAKIMREFILSAGAATPWVFPTPVHL